MRWARGACDLYLRPHTYLAINDNERREAPRVKPRHGSLPLRLSNAIVRAVRGGISPTNSREWKGARR